MMNVKVEIFSQGEEIITGQTLDTNSAWLSQQLVALGFKVTRHSTVGDHLADLMTLLQEISLRADCCICSGGLGPTSDDLTAEAVSQAFGIPLIFDAEAFAQIEAYFIRRQRPMPSSNRKQAMLPQGSRRLDNAVGTAPGFAIQLGQCWFAFVPGVPAEMRYLYQTAIQPYLQQHYEVFPSHLVTLKTFGIGESALQEVVNCIPLPEQVELGFRASVDEVQTKLLFPYDYPHKEKIKLVEQFAAQIGDCVFAIEGLGYPEGDLVDVINHVLAFTKQTLAVVETISQGLVAAKCIGQCWLLQTHYQQSVHSLAQHFDVKLQTDNLMVSALAIAQELRLRSGADFALVQLAEPKDPAGDELEEIYLLYNVLATEFGAYPQLITVGGNLKRKQNQAALYALDLLRRFLQDKHAIPCHYYA